MFCPIFIQHWVVFNPAFFRVYHYSSSTKHFTRLTNQTAKQRSVICHSTQHISTAPDSSGDVLYTTISNALHCTCEACMQLLGHGNPFHKACVDINASGSLELFSYGISRALVSFTHHKPQHLVTLLCDLTSRAAALQRFHFPLTVDHGILRTDFSNSHVGFYGLPWLSIGIMVFKLYKQYFLLPYTNPTPKSIPITGNVVHFYFHHLVCFLSILNYGTPKVSS